MPMTPHRYSDDEVREIFRLATTGDRQDQSLPVDAGGLTLDEIQRIGQEAGIEPRRVAEAVGELDRRGRLAPVRHAVGLPIGMAWLVELPRAPTDREWEQLISHCRTVFDGKGRSSTTGGIRDWSSGDVHIAVEPTTDGEQLRVSARNETAVGLNIVSVVLGSLALAVGVAAVVAGRPGMLAACKMFGGLALVAQVVNVIRSPRWARDREAQLHAVAEYAVKLLSGS